MNYINKLQTESVLFQIFSIQMLVFLLSVSIVSCTETKSQEENINWECTFSENDNPDFSLIIGCEADFQTLASEPMDASIPGARSVKTVIDQLDKDALYFQNSNNYQIHWDFVNTHLSGNGKPIVPELDQFNQTEYYSPSRRFLLGAVTYYEAPDAWVYEIAPYDASNADMIVKAYNSITKASFFGNKLLFHPTSKSIEVVALELPSFVKTITTEKLFADVLYQPLNLGTSVGTLRIMSAHQVETEYVSFRDIVVLDQVPNDISVVMGIITAEFQTPLSHINVLSQNRGTPNMALRGAVNNEDLLKLNGKWVKLDVNAFDYNITEVSKDEADVWWEENKPDVVQVPNLDIETTELRDIELVCNLDLGMDECLKQAIPAYGGKASHYSLIAQIGQDVPVPKAFGIPVYYYWQFMEKNGFHNQISQMLADESFQTDPAIRDQRLQELRNTMIQAPVDPNFYANLLTKLNTDYSGIRMRFRSSTNAEDLDGFTGAGLYTSKSGDPNDPNKPILNAIKEVWASVWFFRAFEERSYRSIDHQTVGMALLVHNSFPYEEANGVALTANPYDTSGMEPGFYINVQFGEHSVVQPDPEITTDQFIYHFDYPGQPITYISHSSLIPEGTNVLTTLQTYELGKALKAIHEYFRPLYGPDSTKWFAMDVEFKFNGDNGETPKLFVKQARPHPGWGK